MIRQIDNQSPQKFGPAEFLVWVQRQRLLAKRVVSCYEAGCLGFVLHRKLAEVGVENFVVRPRNWDEYGSSVKTDARDARELCGHLDRYLAGNDRALCVVLVPTEEQEQERSLSRQRETLAKERKRLQNVGTSSGLYHGVDVPPNWWKPTVFAQLCSEILELILKPFQQVLEVIDKGSKLPKLLSLGKHNSVKDLQKQGFISRKSNLLRLQSPALSLSLYIYIYIYFLKATTRTAFHIDC